MSYVDWFSNENVDARAAAPKFGTEPGGGGARAASPKVNAGVEAPRTGASAGAGVGAAGRARNDAILSLTNFKTWEIANVSG